MRHNAAEHCKVELKVKINIKIKNSLHRKIVYYKKVNVPNLNLYSQNKMELCQ